VAALMVSISGIRGIVGESLTPDIITKYTLAFGHFKKKGTIIVGSDSRTSGQSIRSLVKGCLTASGCRVIDIGIVPTPTVQMEIIHHKADGGIAITASHNPSEWNGLKFMDANSRFLSPDDAATVYQLADNGTTGLADWRTYGNQVEDNGANQRHIDAILDLPYLDIKNLKKRKFKVVVDCVNGAGGLIIPPLLKQFGCETVVLNSRVNGHFAHTPEPLPENLTDLCKEVKKRKADIGFAVDPDVDRCAIIDNTGAPIGEEYTLAAAIKFILKKKLGTVVVNMSTSRAGEDIARYYNCPFIRTAVGEINVAEGMSKEEAVIGGEGNGGVILPELHLGRDAPAAVVLTLQHLLEFGGTMRDLYLSLPQYKIVKDKVSVEGMNPDQVIQSLIHTHQDKQLNLLDGLKIDTDTTWVHLRKSNTEPIIRVMAEAPAVEEAQALAKQFKDEIKELGIRN
jgi:phosphomannomutase